MKEALKALDTRWRRWGRWWGCPGWGCPPMLSYGTVPGGPRWVILSICWSFSTWLCPGGWGRKRSVLGGRVWDATCTSPRGGSLVKVLLPNAFKKEIHLNLFTPDQLWAWHGFWWPKPLSTISQGINFNILFSCCLSLIYCFYCCYLIMTHMFSSAVLPNVAKLSLVVFLYTTWVYRSAVNI